MKYKFTTLLFAFFFITLVLSNLTGCQSLTDDKETINNPGQVILTIFLKLDPNVYGKSYFKKPPQFAVWLEDASKGTIRTVWVTYGTGSGDWGDNIVRPVSLPYWVSRWNLETNSRSFPTPDNPVVDAVTGATPKTVFTVETAVEAGSVWDYFIEVNVSGDYNDTFPAVKKDGTPDENGNGQPSIIYKGRITASPGTLSIPRLAGRTDQWQSVKYILTDMEGITSAKDLLSEIKVSCQSP
jgi:hypothetical protein